MKLGDVTELEPLSEAIRDFSEAAGEAYAKIFLAGALARDLWLLYGHRIETGRATEDLDFAVQCESWEHFRRIAACLAAHGFERPDDRHLQRFRHRTGVLLDLIPFGGIEADDRTLAWPPDGDTVLHVLGFSEVLLATVEFELPGRVLIPVAPLPALALLKLLAWEDRRRTAPRKDAHDLGLILRTYADAGNADRMFDEIEGLADREDFDFERAGAELLGCDLAELLGEEISSWVTTLLERETNPNGEMLLARELNARDPESALELLLSFRSGIGSRQ